MIEILQKALNVGLSISGSNFHIFTTLLNLTIETVHTFKYFYNIKPTIYTFERFPFGKKKEDILEKER